MADFMRTSLSRIRELNIRRSSEKGTRGHLPYRGVSVAYDKTE